MATPSIPLKITVAHWIHEAHKTLLNMRKITRFLARNGNLWNFGLFFSEFGCHGNSFGTLENWDSIYEVADPKTWLFMRKSFRFLAQNWNKCNFGLFLFKFGCHGNSLGSLKIMIASWNLPAPRSPLCMQNNLVAMATPLAPLKFWLAYLNSPTPKTLLFVRKSPQFFAQNWSQCNFGLFLLKFGCLDNFLGSLKIMIASWNLPAPKSPLYMRKISRFLAENWWVQFFAQIWLPWQPPWLLWNFIYHIWIRRPRKPFTYVINSSISCTELKSL